MRYLPLVSAVTTAFLLHVSAAPAPAQRYEAVLRNGDRLTGDKLEDLHDPTHAALDGQPLFGEENPVRRFRDTQRQAVRRGTWVEMTNGDILPGRVVEWSPAAPGSGVPPRLMVALVESPLFAEFGSERIAVRQESVRCITSAESSSPYTPGFFATRDGRRGLGRSFRFAESAVYALTEEGITQVDLADLVELHLPPGDDGLEALRDGVWSDGDVENPVVRLRTERGAELTYCGGLAAVARIDRYRRSRTPVMDCLAIRPAWALETLYVNPAAVVSLSYRRPDEVPLSSLPAEVVEQRSVLHRWNWRRNANVRGERLQSGTLWSDLGVGLHSATAVAFALPPGAKEFTTWVGLDAAVGAEGCVVCRVYRDGLEGDKLWESGFLRGGDEPIRVGPLNLNGAARLVLAVDFGHDGRPAGADPWDMRDEVDWIEPMVAVDRAQLPRPEREPERWIPQLAGWEAPRADPPRFALRPFWDDWRKQWTFALRTDELERDSPLELTRRMQVDLTNAVLPVAAANDNRGRTRHAIYVKVNGEKLNSTPKGVLETKVSRKNEAASREWSLGEFQGRQVEVAVVIEPLSRNGDDPMGLLWESLAPCPLVDNLPPDGRPIAPVTPLTSLAPLSAAARGKRLKLLPGRLTDGKPLEIRGWRFEEGFGTPTGSELVYKLQPQWRRFVAIIGLAGGWQGAGPYSILLDGEPHWECRQPLSFGRSSPGLQIDVPIPPGHETITLRVEGDDSDAAWAWAGFME